MDEYEFDSIDTMGDSYYADNGGGGSSGGSWFDSIGSGLGGIFDTLGTVTGKVLDTASPLLQSGLNYYTTSQQQKQALKQQQAMQANSLGSNKTLWIVGGGVLVVGLLAVVLSRRS
jgi:hypothetical protein